MRTKPLLAVSALTAAFLVNCSSPPADVTPTETTSPAAPAETTSPAAPASPTEAATETEAPPAAETSTERALLDKAMATALTSAKGTVIGIDVESRYIEVRVLVGNRIREVKVSSDGANVLKDEDDTEAADVARARAAQVTIEQALDKTLPLGTGTFYEIELDTHRGKLVWETEFIDNGQRSKVRVDALTGDVLS